MPIDFLKNRNDATQGVNDLLTNQQPLIDSNIAQTQANVQKARSPFLDNLQGLGVDPAEIQAGVGRQTAGLDRNLNQQLAGQRMTNQNNRIGNKFDWALKLAKQYGADAQSAQNFARQIVAQTQAEDFQAGQAQNERNSIKLRQNQQNQATQNSINLQNSAVYRPDFNGALNRFLTGTATMLGTSYAINKANQKPIGPYSQPIGPQNQPYGPNLNEGYNPQPNEGFYPQQQSFYGNGG